MEYLLVTQLLNFCKNNLITDIFIIPQLYQYFLELMQAIDNSLPIGAKTVAEISDIVTEHEKNRQVFEATCIAQVKITFNQFN